MLTLEVLARDLSFLEAYSYGATVVLKCSRAACAEQIEVPLGRVRQRLKAGVSSSYCSRRCQGKHVLEQATTIRDGIAGRVCSECGQWTPLLKMTANGRAKVCRACRRNQPHNKFSIMKSQAQARGVPWSLTFEEMMEFWQEPCSYCGETIETVGLDQVEPSKGYEVGNVVSCCYACNRGKSDDTREEFLERCRRVATRQGGVL